MRECLVIFCKVLDHNRRDVMQLTMKDSKGCVRLKDIAVSVPKTLCSTSIFSSESGFEKYCVRETLDGMELTQIVSKQHPLIMTWLVVSLLSIGVLFPLLSSIN